MGGGLTDAEGVEGHPVTPSAPEDPLHGEVLGGPAPLEVATSPVVVAAGLGPNGGAPRNIAVAPPVDGLDPAIPRLVRRPTPPLNGEVGEAGLVPHQVLPDGRRATPDETRVGVGRVEEARLTRPPRAGQVIARAATGQRPILRRPSAETNATGRRNGVTGLDGRRRPVGRRLAPAPVMDGRAPVIRHGEVTRSPRPDERVGDTLPMPARTTAATLAGEGRALVVAPPRDVVRPQDAVAEPRTWHASGEAPATEARPRAGHALADTATAVPRGSVVIVVALPAT